MNPEHPKEFSLIPNISAPVETKTGTEAIERLVPDLSGPFAKLLAQSFESIAPSVPSLKIVSNRHEVDASVDVPDDGGGQFSVGTLLATAYRISRRLRRGEHCETYSAKALPAADGASDLQGGARVVVKVARVPEDMSDDVAAARLRTLSGLFDKEAEDLRRLNNVDGVARFIERGEYSHCLRFTSITSVFLVQEYIEGSDLAQYMRSRFADASGRFRGLSDPKILFSWIRKMATTLRDVHQRLVVHGYICPANIRVTLDGRPVFVDFGEALFAHVMDERACRTDCGATYRAPERVPSVGSDIYSFGGVMLFLATGEAPPKPYEDIDVLKQQVETMIRNSNPALFQACCGIADIIARCLRYSHTGRIENTTSLLRDIDRFDVSDISEKVAQEATGLVEQARRLETSGHPLLCWPAILKIRDLRRDMEDMAHGVYDIVGSPDEMRGAAADLMDVLQEGDEFSAISVLRFWWPQNMGVNGRFQSKNREAAARGVKIQRVFVLDERLSETLLDEILDAHHRIAVDLKYPQNYSVRYRLVSAEEREQCVRAGRHCGLFLKRGSPTAMFPQYRANGSLEALRFRTDPAILSGLQRIFDFENAQAMPLADLKLPASRVG